MDVASFLESRQDTALSSSLGRDVIVLDSSFNPPHWGHIEMARIGLQSKPEAAVLLLLGVGNADKPQVSSEDLQHRLDMMEIITTLIGAQHVSLGLTRFPLFVEKLKSLQLLSPETNFTVMLGSDTYDRVMDPKYYSIPIAEVERQLRELAHFIVVRRELGSHEDGSPSDLFTFADPTARTIGVSSSRARDEIQQGLDVSDYVPSPVCQYINKHNLYA